MLCSSSVKFFFFEKGEAFPCVGVSPELPEAPPARLLGLSPAPPLLRCGNRKLNLRLGLCVAGVLSETKSIMDLEKEQGKKTLIANLH